MCMLATLSISDNFFVGMACQVATRHIALDTELGETINATGAAIGAFISVNQYAYTYSSAIAA